MYIFIFKLLVVFCFIYGLIRCYLKGTTGWCKSYTCLIGKTVIVTGANSGIGYEAAIDFAKRGARVILACRNAAGAETVRCTIVRETGNNNVVIKIIDLASFDSVRNFAKDINATEERLDILVNNAGIMSVSEPSMITLDGRERVMQVNYYSHFLLTNLLSGLLIRTHPSRIVNVSSIVARWCKNFIVEDNGLHQEDKFSYCKSKLCMIYLTKALAKKLEGTGVTVYSLHPGIVRTNIVTTDNLKNMLLKYMIFDPFGKTAEEGAQTTLYCALSKDIEYLNGEHFEDCERVMPYKTSLSLELCKKVWDVSEKVVNLRREEKAF